RINVKKDYPAIWEYFNKVNRELDGRAETRYDQGAHWTNLRNCAYVDLFNMPKIAWGNLAISSQFAYVASGVFINAPSPLITPGNKYLLAVLNSKLGDYYIRSLGVTRNGGYFEYKPMFVERLPVPKISSETQPLFENLVDYICFCQDCDMSSESIFLETVIDGLVYELYLPDEIKAADAEVLKHLTTPLIPLLRKEGSSKSVVVLSELKDEWPDEKKLEVIENVYKELSDPSHPVSIAMARQKTVPEVRIIEGLDKE
ncbi:MAG: TaqI-like C-terminal specificity domain-containing protein, partial [Smithellaceae bacterium]